MEQRKLIVIGGGAAGFFCAVNAAMADSQLQVTIIEKTGKLLSKVKISGGGRCNVTHACFSVSDMVRNYPRGQKFLKRAFGHFFTTETIQWFEERGVKLKTEADGRMFPQSDSSASIVDCLIGEAVRSNVQILTHTELLRIERNELHGRPSFSAFISGGRLLEADYICVACGGFSKPTQYRWLTDLGHRFESPVPSLFTFNIPKNPVSALMGITVESARVKINGTSFQQEGPLLITHWGLSGPAVLKLSAFAARQLSDLNYQFSISVNWMADYHENSVLDKLKSVRLEYASRKVINGCPFELPRRLWEHHLRDCTINEEVRWADLPARAQNQLAKQLCSQQFQISGKTTFKEEFVTAGGISLGEVDADSMESKIVRGLYFAGEILDVDGITGGFNFQHAWTSGWIAASAITASARLQRP